jgi:protein SCO1
MVSTGQPQAPGIVRRLGIAGIACLLLLSWALPAPGQVLMREVPEPAQGVELVQRLGERVPPELEFTNSRGEKVTIGSYLNQRKPLMLVMVYYNCPLICPMTLEKLQETLNGLPYIVGDDFTVLVVSFDPRNTTRMAADNKAVYLAGYSRPKTPAVVAGWEFHTSTQESARRLSEAIGFRYKLIPETGEYSHASTYVLLTPAGVVSRYVSGLEPDVREVRLALLEASEGKIAQSISDFWLHLCFRWDPTAGLYSLHAMRVMQITRFLTVLGLLTLVAALKAGERARAWRRAHDRDRSNEMAGAGAGRALKPAMGQMP